MSCSQPILAVDYGLKKNDEGKMVHDVKLLDMKHKYFGKGLEELKEIFGDRLLQLPCGKCYSCAIDYSRMWASRIMLETKDHLHNCFLTLTFNEYCVPERLSKRHVQLFIKRLRRDISCQIRYFACGELGEGKGEREHGNPHYHLIIFGYDFPDKKPFKRSKSGNMIYRSEQLDRLWSYKDKKSGRLLNLGFASIGDVTPESAQYVAKYTVKRKLTGVDLGEFSTMSRRPGIGANRYDEVDMITQKIYTNGKQFKIPRYFGKLAEDKKDFMYFINKDRKLEWCKKLSSKKYQFGCDREEMALALANNQRILKDCLKRRYV